MNRKNIEIKFRKLKLIYSSDDDKLYVGVSDNDAVTYVGKSVVYFLLNCMNYDEIIYKRRFTHGIIFVISFFILALYHYYNCQ